MPKFKLWMFLVLVAVLAIVINRVKEVQREREYTKAWKLTKLAKINTENAIARCANEERKWTLMAEELESNIKSLDERFGLIDERSIVFKNRELITHYENMKREAERCRSAALRSADLKKKYERAASHPAHLITPDPPLFVEP